MDLVQSVICLVPTLHRSHSVLTWWACCKSSILSWRIWQSYSLLFLSICRRSFSTAVLSSSCCFSLNSSPNLMTVSCCRALYKVASSSWILWQIKAEKSNFETLNVSVVWVCMYVCVCGYRTYILIHIWQKIQDVWTFDNTREQTFIIYRAS